MMNRVIGAAGAELSHSVVEMETLMSGGPREADGIVVWNMLISHIHSERRQKVAQNPPISAVVSV